MFRKNEVLSSSGLRSPDSKYWIRTA